MLFVFVSELLMNQKYSATHYSRDYVLKKRSIQNDYKTSKKFLNKGILRSINFDSNEEIGRTVCFN